MGRGENDMRSLVASTRAAKRTQDIREELERYFGVIAMDLQFYYENSLDYKRDKELYPRLKKEALILYDVSCSYSEIAAELSASYGIYISKNQIVNMIIRLSI